MLGPRRLVSVEGVSEQLQAVRTGTVESLADIAVQLEAESDVEAMLKRLVDAVVRVIDGADAACATLTDHDGVSAVAWTAAFAGQADAARFSCGQCPSLDRRVGSGVVRIDDLTTDSRWPSFAAAASELGVRSMLSFRLGSSSRPVGSLTAYSHRRHAFPAQAVGVGRSLAIHASLALESHRKLTNLHLAMRTRDVIGQAKGILMERFQVDTETAFHILVSLSQRTNLKVHAIAARLAETGELPGSHSASTTPPRTRGGTPRAYPHVGESDG